MVPSGSSGGVLLYFKKFFLSKFGHESIVKQNLQELQKSLREEQLDFW